MERFYDEEDKDKEPIFGPDGDGDDGDDDDDDDDDDGEETIVTMDQSSIIEVMGLDLAQVELNQQLLDRAIEIAKQGWFWGLKSTKTRMKEIDSIYKGLLKLIDSEEEKEEE